MAQGGGVVSKEEDFRAWLAIELDKGLRTVAEAQFRHGFNFAIAELIRQLDAALTGDPFPALTAAAVLKSVRDWCEMWKLEIDFRA
jgi:hypothetical protein